MPLYKIRLIVMLFLFTDKQVFVLDFGQHLVGYGGHQGCTEYYEE